MTSESEFLVGQWLVNFEGDQQGTGLLSFDRWSASDGWVSLYQRPNVPRSIPALLLRGRCRIIGNRVAWTGMGNALQGVGWVKLSGSQVNNHSHTGSWSSSDKFSGNFTLTRVTAQQIRTSAAVARTWSDIQDWVASQISEKRIFRGVGDNRYALQSTAHREGLFDLDRYLSIIVPAVARELAIHHGMHFDVAQAQGLAELLAVSRHHGFPTPVMDWSSLPWVSLYFAASACGASSPFRIYSLRRDGLEAFTSVAEALVSPSIVPALVEIHSVRTPRIAAQHGLFMVTPCVDVVAPLTLLSHSPINHRLSSIDIPSSMKEEVLQRLNLMGINSFTMTPSLDDTLARLKTSLLTSRAG